MTRRGYTLVELVVVMAILSALMTAAAMVLSGVILHFGRQRDDAEQVLVVRRLAADLRRDAHTALSAQVEDLASAPHGKLTLTVPGGEAILYQAVTDGVEKTVLKDQQAVRREFYRLPQVKNLRFDRQTASPDHILLACTWRQPPPGPQTLNKEVTPLRPYRIEAALVGEAQHE